MLLVTTRRPFGRPALGRAPPQVFFVFIRLPHFLLFGLTGRDLQIEASARLAAAHILAHHFMFLIKSSP
jgi:hypothetical protein